MDAWTILNEVDVIAKWSTDHKKSVYEGGKWSERRDGLEELNKLIEQNPKLSTASMTIYGELMDELRKILDRESNIAVVSTAARTVELLARGLRSKFAGFIGMVLPFLIKRTKDKKKNVRDAMSLAIDAVTATTNPERIQKDIVDWFGIASPESKQTLLEFLYRYFIHMERVDVAFIKALAPLVVKCATDSDVTVREKACMAIGSMRRLLGDAIASFIAPVSADSVKMEKIAQYEAEAMEKWKELNAEKAKLCAGFSDGGEGTELATSVSNEEKVTQEIDSWELLEEIDVSAKLDKTVETQITDKNWKERLAGCEAIKKEVDAAGRITMSERLRELCGMLLKIIEKDVNVNVASCAANVLNGIANKTRFEYKPIANKGFMICFEKLKDKKAILRDALNELLDSSSLTTPLSAYSDVVISALAHKNPQTRAQTAAFLARYLGQQDSSTLPVATLKTMTETITKMANDAEKEVRDEILKCVAAVAKCLSLPIAQKLFPGIFDDNLKSEKIPGLVDEMEKQFGKTATPKMRRLAEKFAVMSNPIKKGTMPANRPASAPRIAPNRPVIKPAAATKPLPRVADPSTNRRPFTARPAPSQTVRPPIKPVGAKSKVEVGPAPRTSSATRPQASKLPLPRAELKSRIAPAPNGKIPIYF
ncbi:unnamed protein product [Caenorhabditis bovis]|uniref:TOG domain-containing protein n=1 Tax=Caenorhabditis bovis TaxID=2654633 RepID=A0A8S1EUL5_9PELO|nr:unnamed protein product [Caenorhabditis bovis]